MQLFTASFTPKRVIAFHAYISQDSPYPLPMHHIIQFDMVPVNKGYGYHAFDGIFDVPSSGTYVFTWSIMSGVQDVVSTELMRNTDVLGSRMAGSVFSSKWGFATGTVVTDVNQGDHVYVRLRQASRSHVPNFPPSRTTFYLKKNRINYIFTHV